MLRSKVSLVAAIAAFSCLATAQESFSFGAHVPIGSINAPGNASNRRVTFASSATEAYLLAGRVTGVNASLQSLISATFASEAVIRVRNSGYTSANDFFDIQIFSEQGFTELTTTNQTFAITGNLVSQLIMPGSLWTFEFYESFDDATGTQAESNWTNLSMNFLKLGPPPISDRFDVTSTPYVRSVSNTYSENQRVHWYELNLLENASADYRIDINTNGTTGEIDDTEIAIYDKFSGTVLFQDDDSGTDFFSRLFFDGSAGRELLAGDYLIAVAGFNADFGADWTVNTNNTKNGDIRLNVSVVPEPATMAVLSVGILALARKKRKSA